MLSKVGPHERADRDDSQMFASRRVEGRDDELLAKVVTAQLLGNLGVDQDQPVRRALVGEKRRRSVNGEFEAAGLTIVMHGWQRHARMLSPLTLSAWA